MSIQPDSAADLPARRHAPWRLQLARAGMLAAVVALSVFIYSIRDRADILQRYGYPGIFLLSVLASATIVLPAPGLVFVAGAGALGLNPIGVGLAAGLGATVGELSGYITGWSGQAVIENRELYDRLVAWMRRYGVWVIAVLAFLPLPVFDLAGVAAGALKMPVARFLIFCALGKIPKMTLVALAGAYSLDWVTQFLSRP
jgi:membrane protein YqaA with SNARE-associated domain